MLFTGLTKLGIEKEINVPMIYKNIIFIHIPQFANRDLEYFIQNYRPATWEKKFYHEYLNTDGIDFIARFENREEDLNKI